MTWKTMLPLAALTLAACASYPKPTERLIASESALRAADEVGAQQQPQAQLEWKLAQEEITKAKALMEQGENKRADYMLLRAKADAELAIALSKQAQAQAEANKAAQSASAITPGTMTTTTTSTTPATTPQ